MDERTLRSLVSGLMGRGHPDYDDAMQEARLCVWLMDRRFDATKGNRRGYLIQRVRWHLQNVAHKDRLRQRRETVVFARQPWPTLDGPDTRDIDREALVGRIGRLAEQSTGQARALWLFVNGKRGCLRGSAYRTARQQWRRLLNI